MAMKSIDGKRTDFLFHTYVSWVAMIMFMLALPPLAMAEERDTIRIGGDYRTITLMKGERADFCHRECDKDEHCRAWTYSKQGVKTSKGIKFYVAPNISLNLGGRKSRIIPSQCHLKYKQGRKQHNKCCTSGIKGSFARQKESVRCAIYAENALLQNDKNISRHCGFRGKFWHDSYGRHYDWCVNIVRSKSALKTALRKVKLVGCDYERPR